MGRALRAVGIIPPLVVRSVSRVGPPASPRKRRPDASVYRELREEVERARFVKVEGLLSSRDEDDWNDAEAEAGRVLDLIRLRQAKFAEDRAWD
ncbi:hypothetical protein AAP_05688 [Ascosphaera apis ARSEF 7405]|uniref:Uncharacterized protein n=1 Tax=Ascosphaera apis ARSEF 7405 TaxID=392613 RepID=A0A167VFG2_9EURO|nr:hypothetical protein AAP_05688 [Ascosphaera apis ARSEF 7405]